MLMAWVVSQCVVIRSTCQLATHCCQCVVIRSTCQLATYCCLVQFDIDSDHIHRVTVQPIMNLIINLAVIFVQGRIASINGKTCVTTSTPQERR